MINFNQERMGGVIAGTRFARDCLTDASKYAAVRRTFGKTLRQHQVIRVKLAEMARTVESCQALVEQLACALSVGTDPRVIGARIMLAKVHVTRAMEMCAREASQVFGGNCYLRHGVGERVERIYREVRVMAIGGGSEEILLDSAARLSKL
eukprot:TRINITY_DN1727_c0_g3_i1.p1 TRINITY_DN1727_c0_g3~~TRINITY_DN1727_c0_g3_i1.p1  ORF type:complete len:166 (+),score=53.22 TRINITY_DN1727_c0_g3_i1:46-498(+)